MIGQSTDVKLKVLCDWLVKLDSQRRYNMVIGRLMCLKYKRYRLKGLKLSNGKCVTNLMWLKQKEKELDGPKLPNDQTSTRTTLFQYQNQIIIACRDHSCKMTKLVLELPCFSTRTKLLQPAGTIPAIIPNQYQNNLVLVLGLNCYSTRRTKGVNCEIALV